MKPLVFLISIIAIGFLNTVKSQNQKTVLKVNYVDFGFESLVAIHCSLFDSAFDGYHKYWEPIERSDIDTCIKYLNDFTKVKVSHIDTRGKITYSLDNKIYQMCFNSFGIFTDGTNYFQNPKLFLFFKTKIKQ